MKDNTILHVLMTGAGAPGAAGIIKCLKLSDKIKLTVGDASENAVGKYLNPNFIQLPLASDAAFLNKMLTICLDHEIQLILPLVTRELLLLSSAKTLFKEYGIEILVSDLDKLTIANDKGKLYQFLKNEGIAVPDFKIVKTFQEFTSAGLAMGYPSKKFCFKPCIANGSRGFRIIDDSIDLNDLVFNYKPDSSIITFEMAARFLRKDQFPELLISEYLPGEEYSVDCVLDQGKMIICVPRLRSKIVAGISTAGIFKKNEQIIIYCVEIAGKLSLHGNIGFQVKMAEDGSYKILEINPRVQGTIVAGLGAGVNLPLIAISQIMGWEIKPNEMETKWETSFIRYYNEVFFEINEFNH